MPWQDWARAFYCLLVMNICVDGTSPFMQPFLQQFTNVLSSWVTSHYFFRGGGFKVFLSERRTLMKSMCVHGRCQKPQTGSTVMIVHTDTEQKMVVSMCRDCVLHNSEHSGAGWYSDAWITLGGSSPSLETADTTCSLLTGCGWNWLHMAKSMLPHWLVIIGDILYIIIWLQDSGNSYNYIIQYIYTYIYVCVCMCACV